MRRSLLMRAVAIVTVTAAMGTVCDGASAAVSEGLFSMSGVGSMSTVRAFFPAAPLPDGNVLMVGGSVAGTPLSTAEEFNPTNNTFSNPQGSPLGDSVFGEVAAPLPNGKVLLAGGRDANGSAGSALFDPTSGFNTAGLGPMVHAQVDAAAAPLPDGRVLIAGGYSDPSTTPVVTAEVFNPTGDTFSAVGSMNTPRVGAIAAPLPNGDVLIAGGTTGPSLTDPVDTAELFNPTTGTFSSIAATMTTPRVGAVATPLPDGKVLIAGGFNLVGFPFRTTVFLATAEVFNPANDTFSSASLSTMQFPRAWAAASPLPNGKVLIAGGQDTATTDRSDAELFESAPEASAVGGNFGAQTVHDPSVDEPVTINNLGAQGLAIAGASLAGADPSDFAIVADGCAGRTLAFSQTCTITVRFTPARIAARTSEIVLDDNETSPGKIQPSGTGVPVTVGGPGLPAPPERPELRVPPVCRDRTVHRARQVPKARLAHGALPARSCS